MQLTINSPEDVLRSGKAEQSPTAARFIRDVRETLGICVEACYLQSGTHPLFSEKHSIEAQIKAGGVPFVNEDILTVYIHSQKSADITAEYDIRDELFAALMRAVRNSGETIDYPRLYLPEEMQYYGWYSQPREKWDMMKVIPTALAVSHQSGVFIECIDRTALFNYLFDAQKTLSRCDFVREIGAKVYCAYDETRGNAALYVIVSPDTLHEMNISLFKNAFAERAYQLLKPMDLWDVITPDAVTPIVTEWNALTKDHKFAMLRR